MDKKWLPVRHTSRPSSATLLQGEDDEMEEDEEEEEEECEDDDLDMRTSFATR